MPTQILQSFSFTRADYVMALPMILLALFALGILLIDLMLPAEWKRLNAWTALLGIAFSAWAVTRLQIGYLWPFHYPGAQSLVGSTAFSGAVLMDSSAIFFCYLFLAGAAIAILMSVKYLEIERENHGEFYALVLFSVVGMMSIACGYDLVLLFIGLELMAISTYVLVGFLRRDRRSNEAALKYLLLGAFSSGIFAYGLSLFYGISGSTNLGAVSHALTLRMAANKYDPIAIIALLTTITGLLFKVAAVPFHQWAPDAYEGAPTSITGYMSVAVKAAAWALLLRIFIWGIPALRHIYLPVLVFVAIATMTGGNLAAMTQTNLKRLLAYSSISHVGYMLLGLIAGSAVALSATGVKGIMIYLLVYTFMNLGAFAVITSLRRREIIGDEIDDIAGLMYKAPTEAVLMLVFLLSLSGIPPLAGFWGKYFIFLSLIEAPGHYALAAVGVLYSVVGLYYYMRIVSAMFMRPAVDTEKVSIGWSMKLALGITALGTLYIGINPNWFIRAVEWSYPALQTAAPTVSQLLH